MAQFRILIIDDSPLYRMLTKAALQKLNYDIQEANNGLEGLAKLESHRPDLVITDVLMPTMDGYEFLRRLRNDARFAMTKVIFYTGTYSSADDAALAKSGGVLSHLIKPAEPEQIQRAVVEALVERPTSSQPLNEDYEQEHLRLLTNQLSAKVAELERKNFELREEVKRRTQAETEAIRSKDFFKALADSIPQLAWQMREDGKIVYANQRWREFQQIPINHLDQWFHCIHPQDRSALREQVQAAFDQKRGFQCEARLIQGSNQIATFYWIAAIAVSDPVSKETSWFGTCTDISAQKKFESKLIQLKEQAEALSRAKSEFLTNISHEIRTPLTAILGFSELLHDQTRASESNLLLDRISENAKSLLEMLTDVITISELEASNPQALAQVFSLRDFLNQVVSTIQTKAEAKNLDFLLGTPPTEKDLFQSHPEVLQRILSHLLENAIQFTEKGSVHLETRFENKRELTNQSLLTFEVEDTGIGISAGNQKYLFRPFSQIDGSATRLRGGLGLGLFLSRKLAESIGGNLDLVRSNEGRGSCFRVSAPIYATDEIVSGVEPD